MADLQMDDVAAGVSQDTRHAADTLTPSSSAPSIAEDTATTMEDEFPDHANEEDGDELNTMHLPLFANRRFDSGCSNIIKRILRFLYPPKLNGLRGVYVPACIGVLGPTIFLRMSYVISEAGFLLTLLMICINFIISVMTISGVSAIVTNGKMRGGGAYFLISRTLGSELGSSIGWLLMAEHIIGAVYYMATFSEILQLSSGSYTGPLDYNYDYSHGVTVGSVCLVICLSITVFGPRGFATVALLFFAVMGGSIALAISSFYFTHGNAIPSNTTNATVDKYFTGPKWETLNTNIYQHEDEAEHLSNNHFENFLKLFSIVFAPFSSIIAGANFTGHTANPRKKIPQGMFAACMTGIALFIVMALTISLNVYKLYDLPHGARDVVLKVCVNEWVIIIGLLCCCLASSAQHMLSTGTLLRIMIDDNVVPFFNTMRFPCLGSTTHWFWKRWHHLCAWCFCQAFLFAGSPQTVAPLLTLMYFLFSSVVNGAVVLLVLIGAPNFRPTFRYWTFKTVLAGTIIPLIAMFGIDTKLSLIFIATFFAIVMAYTIAGPETKFGGEVSNAIIYHQVRKYLLRLDQSVTAAKGSSAKFWRPSPLLLDTSDPSFLRSADLNLARVANNIKKGGLFVISSLIRESYSDKALALRETRMAEWHAIISRERFKAFPVCTLSDSLQEGVRQSLLLTGLGPVRPNMVMVDWFDSGSIVTPNEFIAVVKDVQVTSMHLALCRHFKKMDANAILFYRSWMRTHRDAMAGRTMCLDVWALPLSPPSADTSQGVFWPEYETSVLMCMQLANTLRMNAFWKNATHMRVVTFVSYDYEVQNEVMRWKAFLKLVRIDARVLVLSLQSQLQEVQNSVDVGPLSESFVADEESVSPIRFPAMGAQSPFYTCLTPQQRIALARQLMNRHSTSTCMTFLPLAPCPQSQDANLSYLEEIEELTKDLPPMMLVYAKTNVIYTEL